MTRTEFIALNRIRMAGLALDGVTSLHTEGPLVRASRALSIIPNVDAWLGELFDQIVPPPQPAPPLQQRAIEQATVALTRPPATAPAAAQPAGKPAF